MLSENDTLPPHELARLEQVHQKMKDEAEEWQDLLENMNKRRTGQKTDNTENPQPAQKKTR